MWTGSKLAPPLMLLLIVVGLMSLTPVFAQEMGAPPEEVESPMMQTACSYIVPYMGSQLVLDNMDYWVTTCGVSPLTDQILEGARKPVFGPHWSNAVNGWFDPSVPRGS